MTQPQLALWDRDKAAITAAITSQFAPLKILLKTKDEPERLKLWLRHHGNIVGPENLIILDNMSTKPAVLGIYAQTTGECTIFQFQGFHNAVHNTASFPELYAALRASCRYFVFLDTDECLTLYDGADHFHNGPEIISFLNEHPGCQVFPGTWLQNLTGHSDRFMLWRPNGPLPNGLKWGKPVLASACDVSGVINHNTQINHALYDEALPTDLFILHRDRLSRAERIEANMRKLVSYGAVRPGEDIADILARPAASFPAGNVQHYVSEIVKLSRNEPEAEAAADWWFTIDPTGAATWNAGWQRAALQDFLKFPRNYTQDLFGDAVPPAA